MKNLFDQRVPKPLLAHLSEHEMRCAFELGWTQKKKGERLALAEASGFELPGTTDQNLPHQQNLCGRKIGIFILARGNSPEIKPQANPIAAQINIAGKSEIYLF